MFRFVKRHLLSLSALFLAILVLAGWHSSTRALASYNAETPFGIFQFQSESSMFQAGAKFMKHEHRWVFWKNSDAIWGDQMQFIAAAPEFRIDGGLFALLAPYWQLCFTLLITSISLFFIEKRRLTSAIRGIDDPEKAEFNEK